MQRSEAKPKPMTCTATAAPAAGFLTLGTSCAFSRAWYQLRVFPRLVPVARFPALGTSCAFSRAWYQLRVFPALGTSCTLYLCMLIALLDM